MSTILADLIDYCNTQIGKTIKRDDVYYAVKTLHKSWYRCDVNTVRNYLMMLKYAGYIDIMNLTYCKVLKQIPTDKTIIDFQIDARLRKRQKQYAKDSKNDIAETD